MRAAKGERMPWRPVARLIAMVRPVSTAKTLSASATCLCHRGMGW